MSKGRDTQEEKQKQTVQKKKKIQDDYSEEARAGPGKKR